MPKPKETPHCRDCDSINMTCSGELSWNAAAQRWEVEDAYDGYTCQDCGEENKWANWKPTTPEELAE